MSRLWNARLVVFRTDASLDIGTGHVMRCLTMAEELKKVGSGCRFVCREHPGNLVSFIRERGFEAAVLPLDAAATREADSQRSPDPSHYAWLGGDWKTDADAVRAALGADRCDWLVVDHYALDRRWESEMRPACRRLLVIDDLADRAHDCDLLLDQNLGRDAGDYAGLVPAGSGVLAGPQYGLLRREFGALREYSLSRRSEPQLKGVLISMGGVDSSNATSRILRALKDCPLLPGDCCITVVVGQHAPWLQEIRELAAKMPWATQVRVNVGNMAALLADTDLAIGAAGGSAWERCCLGVPTVLMVLAENQRAGASALVRQGAAVCLGADEPLESALRSALARLSDPEALRRMSRAASRIIDGEGVKRVMSRMVEQNA